MKAALKLDASICTGKLLRDYLETRCPQSQARVFLVHGQPGVWGVCVLKKDTRFYETQKGFYNEKAGYPITAYCADLLRMAGYEKKHLDNGGLYFG